MGALHEQLPRVFQANLARLYEQVIVPVLDSIPYHNALETGEALDLDQFLDRAKAQVDNYTGNEAAKAFVLMLAGVFERQLSIWARSIHDAGLADMSMLRNYEPLLASCASAGGIDLTRDGLGEVLTEMLVVANVVRHGEGQSCERLRVLAPQLWDETATDYLDLLPGTPIASEHLRIRKDDLIRYIRATTRFWGFADSLPMAVIDLPY